VKKNGVFELTNDEYLAVLPVIRGLERTWLGEADGAVVNDRRGFLWSIDDRFMEVIGQALGMPDRYLGGIGNLNWFEDEITTMWWFGDGRRYDAYFLAVLNAPQMSADNADCRVTYLSVLADLVQYWTKEVVNCTPDGLTRDFTVYLVDGPGEPRPEREPWFRRVAARVLGSGEKPVPGPPVPAGPGPVVVDLGEGGTTVEDDVVFWLEEPPGGGLAGPSVAGDGAGGAGGEDGR